MSKATSEGYRLLHRDLSEVSYADLVAFLGLKMRETELYDYKHDFPKEGADLAKTMAAFANMSGGTLLIGVAQDKNTGGPSDVVGVDEGENAAVERVQQIALRHIIPALPIELKAITIPHGEPAAGRRVVIVRAHESPQAPHAMADTNAIYVRTGSISHPEKLAELRWLEHLLERRRSREQARIDLWNDSVALAEAYARAEASKSIWWFILATSPTYPYGGLKPERDVRAIMSELVGDAIPCPGGVLRRNVSADSEGRGIEFIRIHQAGFVFRAWAFPSSFKPMSGDWLVELVAQGWQLGAKVLRKLEWSGHVTVRAQLQNVAGRVLDPLMPESRSVVNEVIAEAEVLAPEMLNPESGVLAATRLLDRLIWGMGNVGYSFEVVQKWMTDKLSRGGPTYRP